MFSCRIEAFISGTGAGLHFEFEPVGVVHSCFKEKFGIPRQAGLAVDAPARIELMKDCRDPATVRGLAEFSHIWVIFVFHQCLRRGWKPTVRPPRCGGNHRTGVFATRSPFRPNPVGISCVRLTGIHHQPPRMELGIRGGDLLDGTPVLDIKPYLPWADSRPHACGGFAADPPLQRMTVSFSPEAEALCRRREAAGLPDLRRLIVQILSLDPRPAYAARDRDDKHYHCRLYDLDVEWSVSRRRVEVLDLRTIIDGD
jgi:tRNA-Thr(GGU) m(6)t(6)A37 methyltransferase TsaA